MLKTMKGLSWCAGWDSWILEAVSQHLQPLQGARTGALHRLDTFQPVLTRRLGGRGSNICCESPPAPACIPKLVLLLQKCHFTPSSQLRWLLLPAASSFSPCLILSLTMVVKGTVCSAVHCICTRSFTRHRGCLAQ